MKAFRIFAIAAVLLLQVVPLAAQECPTPRAGDRIRIRYRSGTESADLSREIEGAFVSADAEAVTIMPDGSGAPHVIALASMTRLQLRTKVRSATLGTGLGAMAGAFVFGGITSATAEDGFILSKADQVGMAVVAGLIVGAVLGAAVSARDRWEVLDREPGFHVGLDPSQRRVGLTYNVRF